MNKKSQTGAQEIIKTLASNLLKPKISASLVKAYAPIIEKAMAAESSHLAAPWGWKRILGIGGAGAVGGSIISNWTLGSRLLGKTPKKEMSDEEKAGATIGAIIGFATGPTIFKHLDNTTARIVGTIGGGIVGSLGGSVYSEEMEQ